jgi:GT2 family glycosyltransferase
MAASVAPVDPSVAVLIVNYNSGEMLARCLAALSRQTVRDFRTIVVDNASTDVSAEGIEALHANVTLVRAGKNLGFAAGNNLALAHAGKPDWIALLNPDAFPQPDWLERLLLEAYAWPQFSFFGCRMLLADTPQFLDGTGDVYHVSGITWRRDHGVAAERGVALADEIFGPCAAAALFSRAALDEAGAFDERYFCYHEDVDLAFRLRLLGHRCRYVPEAVVHHVSSGITGRRSDFATYHGHRNLVWTYVKDMPGVLFWLFLPAHLLLNAASLFVFAFRGQLGVILRAKRDAIAGLGDALRQRRVIQGRRRASALALLAVMRCRLRRL